MKTKTPKTTTRRANRKPRRLTDQRRIAKLRTPEEKFRFVVAGGPPRKRTQQAATWDSWLSLAGLEKIAAKSPVSFAYQEDDEPPVNMMEYADEVRRDLRRFTLDQVEAAFRIRDAVWFENVAREIREFKRRGPQNIDRARLLYYKALCSGQVTNLRAIAREATMHNATALESCYRNLINWRKADRETTRRQSQRRR